MEKSKSKDLKRSQKFKEYYKDIGMAIESFKKSEQRVSAINNRSEFETVFDRGIIFWLNNVDDDSSDLLQKLYNIVAPKDFNHDGIFLVDNKKMEFIFIQSNLSNTNIPELKLSLPISTRDLIVMIL